ARKETELDGDARFSGHDLHSHSVEVATFTGDIAAELFIGDQPTTANPHLVAHRHGERVKQVSGRRTQLLQGRAELMKEGVDEARYRVQAAVEARTTEHTRHQPRLSEEGATALDVAAEVEGRHQRGGDDFRVGQLAPTVV